MTLFPKVTFTLDDGRTETVQPTLGEMLHPDVREPQMAGDTLRMMSIVTWHAARRSRPDIPDTFDEFAARCVGLEVTEDGEGKATGDTPGPG